jgi:predicted transposase/invertase (TIGR01784 family)
VWNINAEDPSPMEKETGTKINNTHDSFFKEVMGRREIYLSFLRHHLSKDMVESIDFRKLRPDKAHFIEKNLRHLYSDCFFRAKLKKRLGYGDVLIYMLVEHQSTVDRMIAYRMWHYIFSAWRHYLKSNPEGDHLPLIVPILVYHGKPEHNAPLQIRELVRAPQDQVNRVFDEPIRLVDIQRIADERLRQQAELSAVLLTLKYIVDRNLPISMLLTELARIEDPGLRRFTLEAVLIYMFSARDDVDPEVINKEVERKLGPTAKEAVMTVAERLRKEGEARGLERGLERGLKQGVRQGVKQGVKQGREEAVSEVVGALLRSGFDEEFIVRNAGISRAKLRRLEKKKP